MATYIPVESQSDVDKIWMREALDMVISLILLHLYSNSNEVIGTGSL